jgi:O-acetyl-ADP-ribose deacetylase (regulator of RNase III)
VSGIGLWHGDICDLEVDAIVNAASTSLWMTTGVAGAIKRCGGESIEFEAVRSGPAELGSAVVTGGGKLACRYVIHAVSLGPDRRTSAAAIEAATRSAMAAARELGVRSLAFPALGTGVGGFPLDQAARIMIGAIRDELEESGSVEDVILALRGTTPYAVFEAALGIRPAVQDAGAGPPAAGQAHQAAGKLQP